MGSKIFSKVKLVCLLMAVLLFGGAALGCKNTSNQPETGSTVETETEAAPTVLTLAENGKSDYQIVYARELSSDSTVTDLISTLTKTVKKNTDVSLRSISDRYYEEGDDSPAILIGVTKYPESQAVAATLKTGDYFVGVCGNRVVLCGNTSETVIKAINYFINNIVVAQGKAGKTLTLSSEANFTSHTQYGLDSIQCLGHELREYRMVIPANATLDERTFAKTLHYYLITDYGYELEYVTDAEAPSEYEILIGATSRTTASASGNDYTVSAGNGKLQLIAGSMVGYDGMLQYVKETLLPSGNSNNCTVPEGTVTLNATDDPNGAVQYLVKREGDVRLFFYNIYGHPNYNQELRQQMQLELFQSYDVDVLALQEFTTHSSRQSYAFPALLAQAGYTEVDVGFAKNNTPLFYRADRLDVLQSGFLMFDEQYNNEGSKSVTWAVFQVKATGKCFIAMSTHFCYFGGTEGTVGRTQHAQATVDLIADIRSKYPQYASLPVIGGGDLNCTLSSAPMTVFRNAGMQSAWEIAQSKLDLSSSHDYAEYDDSYGAYTSWSQVFSRYSDSIDQAWVSGNGLTVKNYASVTDFYALLSSDHCPQLVDISFE